MYQYDDSFQLRGLRHRLVKHLEQKGIRDAEVLRAISRVRRHAFLESGLSLTAYEDIALPIAEGQTISQPYTVAYQTELLAPRPGMKVLEIGTGSGYQAAILLEIGVKLFSMERYKALHAAAKHTLMKLGYRPTLRLGDGTAGWGAQAPFDGILVTAASPHLPASLLDQLAVGGRLVIPVGDRQSQVMHLVVRQPDGQLAVTQHDTFRFVPLVGREGYATE